MDPKFLATIKARLEEDKTKLEMELGRISTRSPKTTDETFVTDFPVSGDKEDENAAEVATFSDNLSLEEALNKSLRDANSALAAIAKGTYGVCKYCKTEIDERRLMARPTSSSCIACKKSLTQEV